MMKLVDWLLDHGAQKVGVQDGMDVYEYKDMPSDTIMIVPSGTIFEIGEFQESLRFLDEVPEDDQGDRIIANWTIEVRET